MHWFVLVRNSKPLERRSGGSWWPIHWCWTSMASDCWIRVGMLLGRRTGRSVSDTLMSNYTAHTHTHTRSLRVWNCSQNFVNLFLCCQFLVLCPLARMLVKLPSTICKNRCFKGNLRVYLFFFGILSGWVHERSHYLFSSCLDENLSLLLPSVDLALLLSPPRKFRIWW